MSNLGNSIKNVALLSRKDVAMLVALFIAGSLTSVIYLYRNPIYVKQLQPIMLTLSLIIFMILALNVSYIAYKVLSQANILHALMVAKREDTPLKKLIVTLIIMNFLAFANFSFIVVGFAFDANLAKNNCTISFYWNVAFVLYDTNEYGHLHNYRSCRRSKLRYSNCKTLRPFNYSMQRG